MTGSATLALSADFIHCCQCRGAGEEKEDKLVSGEDSSKQSTDEKRDNDSPRERPSPRQRPKSSKFTRRQEAKPKDEPKQEQKNANSNR